MVNWILPSRAICDNINSMETNQTLLERASKAVSNGEFNKWYYSLSLEEQEQFKLEFHNAMVAFGEAIESFNTFLLELPQILEKMTDIFRNSFTDAALKVFKAISENQNAR